METLDTATADVAALAAASQHGGDVSDSADPFPQALAKSPSPVEFERGDSKLDALQALEITTGYLEAELKKCEAECENAARVCEGPTRQQCLRPGRLGPAVPDSGETTFTGSRHKGLIKAEASELPAFRYLAALEEAVHSGEALAGRIPDIPTTLSTCAKAHCTAVPLQSARGLPRAKHTPSGSIPLRTCGGLLANAPSDRPCTDTRFFFSDEGWGVQPPLSPGARKHVPAPATAFGTSVLRGAPLSQLRRGPHASALWVNTEKARLRAEVAKPFGSSAAMAFIQNGGPNSLESLQQGLCDRELL